MFSTVSQSKIYHFIKLCLLHINVFNLIGPHTIVAWFRVKPLPKDKFNKWFKLKALADDKVIVTEMLKFAFGRVENIVGKGENAGYHHCLLFL